MVILEENGDVLYSQTLGLEIPIRTEASKWKQASTVLNSRDNTVKLLKTYKIFCKPTLQLVKMAVYLY